MSKKLISVDLDATFIHSDQQISQYAKDYVKKLIANGHHFIINTGRPHQSAVNFLKELQIHEPILVNNGSAIIKYDQNYDKIEDFYLFEINHDLLIELLSTTKHMLKTAIVTTLYKLYSYDFKSCPWWVLHESDKVKFVEGDIDNIIQEPAYHMEIYVKDEFKDEFIKIISQEKYTKVLGIIEWGSFDGASSYEISSIDADKGKSTLLLAEKLHINKEDTIGFGDQLNDIPLLVDTGDGVAMINGRDEVKQIANHITKKDNNEDGVILYLEELNLI